MREKSIFLISLLVLASLAIAESITFWKGFVFIGGQPAANGTVVEAFVNNVTLVANYTVGTIASGRDGYYIIPVVVATIDGGHNVSFRVNGVYPYTGANGSSAALQPVTGFGPNLLNISINKTADGGACRPYTGVTNATSYNHSGCSGNYCVHDLCRNASTYCGDGFCDSGESSASCSADCGATPTPTPTPAAGGGAAKTETPAPPVEVTVTVDVPANVPRAIDITKTESVAVDEIIITSKEAATSVTVNVKESSKPADAPPPIAAATGAVYKYVDITVTNIATSAIANAKVKFKVSKSWINSNKIDATTVKLNRNVGSAWQQLSTRKDSEDAADITYEAETPGFSTFAITGEKAAAAPAPAPLTTCGNKYCDIGHLNICESPSSCSGDCSSTAYQNCRNECADSGQYPLYITDAGRCVCTTQNPCSLALPAAPPAATQTPTPVTERRPDNTMLYLSIAVVLLVILYLIRRHRKRVHHLFEKHKQKYVFKRGYKLPAHKPEHKEHHGEYHREHHGEHAEHHKEHEKKGKKEE